MNKSRLAIILWGLFGVGVSILGGELATRIFVDASYVRWLGTIGSFWFMSGMTITILFLEMPKDSGGDDSEGVE